MLVATGGGGGAAPSIVAAALEVADSFFTFSMRLLGFGFARLDLPTIAKNPRRTAASASPIITPTGGVFAFALSPRSICSLTRRIAEGTTGRAFARGVCVIAAASAPGATKRGFTDVGAANGTSSTTGPAGAVPGRVPFSSACMSGVVERKSSTPDDLGFVPAEDP